MVVIDKERVKNKNAQQKKKERMHSDRLKIMKISYVAINL